MLSIIFLVCLGWWLGLRVHSRLGAAALCLSAATCLHALAEAGPNLMHGSAYGRNLAASLATVGVTRNYSLIEMFAFSLGGLVIAIVINILSDDRKYVAVDPESKEGVRRRRKLRREAAKLRHDTC
jgi:hypothetical protein